MPRPTRILLVCSKCGQDYKTSYGMNYNAFECKACEKKRIDRVKRIQGNYQGIRIVREPTCHN